jgi:hypothetical protein
MTWGWNTEQYAEAQLEGDVEASTHGTSSMTLGYRSQFLLSQSLYSLCVYDGHNLLWN